MRDVVVGRVDVLGPVAVQPVDLQHGGEPPARGAPRRHADGHGDGGPGPVGEGDELLRERRVEVPGAGVEGGLVARPGDVLQGGDGAGLARGPVHAGGVEEEVPGEGEVAGRFGVAGSLFQLFGHGEERLGVGFEVVGGVEVVLRMC